MDKYEVTIVGHAERAETDRDEVAEYTRMVRRDLRGDGFTDVQFFDRQLPPRYDPSWLGRSDGTFKTGVQMTYEVEANSPDAAYRKATKQLKESLSTVDWCRAPKVVIDTPKGGKVVVAKPSTW
jgi:hypothetical protein